MQNYSNINNMFSHELKSRNYTIKTTPPNWSNISSIICDSLCLKFISDINNNDLSSMDEIMEKHYHSEFDGNMSLLKIAILSQNIDVVRKVLSYTGYKIKDKSVLAFACESGVASIPELLKCQDIDVNYKGGSQNEIPLYYLLNDIRNKQYAQLLLDTASIDLSTPLNNGKTLIYNMIANNKTDVSLELLLNYVSLKLSKTELDFIFSAGSSNTVNWVLTHNIQPSEQQFFELIKRHDISIATLGLVNNINVNYQDVYGKTALMYSIETNASLKIEFLLGLPNIDLSIIDNYYMTSLLYAVTKGDNYCIKLLVEHLMKLETDVCNSIINQSNNNKETALMLAAKKNNTIGFKNIYDTKCANINCSDIMGLSLLHHSIKLDNMCIFDILINDENLSVNIQDHEGNTPLMHAVKNSNNHCIFELLLSPHLDINIVNNKGMNILGFVINQKYYGGDESKVNKSYCTSGDYASFPQCFESGVISLDNQMSSTRYSSLSANQTTFNPNGLNNTVSVKYKELVSTLLSKKNIELDVRDINNKTPIINVINNSDIELFNILMESENFNPNIETNCMSLLMYVFELFNKNDQISKTRSAPSNFVGYTPTNSNWDIISEPDTLKGKDLRGPIKLDSLPSLSSDSNPKIDTTLLMFFTQLLNHKAININAKDYLDNTILHLISKTSNNIHLLKKILMCKDIDINSQNYLGKTPMMITTELGLWENLKLLISHSAKTDIKDNDGRLAADYVTNSSNQFIYNKIVSTKNENQSSVNKKTWFF